jgi:hypothetical protein
MAKERTVFGDTNVVTQHSYAVRSAHVPSGSPRPYGFIGLPTLPNNFEK